MNVSIKHMHVLVIAITKPMTVVVYTFLKELII